MLLLTKEKYYTLTRVDNSFKAIRHGRNKHLNVFLFHPNPVNAY